MTNNDPSTDPRILSFAQNRSKQYQSKLWIIGDGRSGTTWVSNLINHDRYFREVFEPFHPRYIPSMRFLSSHYYARPGSEKKRLHNASRHVFSGSLWHPRTDSDNAIGLYDGLLVKDIFANLFAYWVKDNFSDIKIVLLIRNPFAVALSKYVKRDWDWVTDPMTLFNQADLRKDYLEEYGDIIMGIGKTDSYILKQILIWSIIHFVPFRQFNSDQICTVFYENIYKDPAAEISRLSSCLGRNFDELSEQVIRKPSKVAGFNIQNGRSPITSWMNDLPASIIDQGLKILEKFHLVDLYDQTSMPNRFNIDDF
jgi:hypothetical protein